MINLHHADSVPDWEKIEPKAWNIWQRTAAKTSGIITPGNVASLIGLVLVLWGFINIAKGDVYLGLIKIGIGRLMDLVDGGVAQLTHTKSMLSEAVDAAVDKLELAVGLPILIQQDILPLAAGIIIGVQNLANTILAAIVKKKGNELRPSMWGKFATAIQWGAIVAYGASAVAAQWENETIAQVLRISAHIAVGLIFVPMGFAATIGYARDTFTKDGRGQ